MNAFCSAGYAVAVVSDTTVSFMNEMVVIEITVDVTIMVDRQVLYMDYLLPNIAGLSAM